MKKIIIKILTVALEKVADADVMLFEKATDDIKTIDVKF